MQNTSDQPASQPGAAVASGGVAPAQAARPPWLLRLALIGAGIGLWFLTQTLIAGRTPPAAGINDGMHNLLAPLHDYFYRTPWAANALMIVSSAFIDGLAIFVMVRAVTGPTIRPFLGLFILFALRQLMQACCSLPEPKQMIWEYPGFPAILVTYGVATDLFFSGHTAVATYGSLELGRLGRRWLVSGVAIIVFEALTVLTLRAHYTMDVFAALMAAFVADRLAEWLAPGVDRGLERLRAGRGT